MERKNMKRTGMTEEKTESAPVPAAEEGGAAEEKAEGVPMAEASERESVPAVAALKEKINGIPMPAGEGEDADTGAGKTSAAKPHFTKKMRLLAAALGVLIAAFAFLAGWLGSTYSRDPRLRRLEALIETIEEHYYIEPDLDALYDDLYNAALPDRFSSYFSAEEQEVSDEEQQGRNKGFGFATTTIDGNVCLYKVVQNSPADLAGLEEGMYFIGWKDAEGQTVTGTRAALLEYLSASAGGTIGVYASFIQGDELSEENFYTVTAREYAAAYCSYRDSEASFAFRDGGTDGATVLTDVTAEKGSEGALTGLDEDTAYIRLDEFNGNCAAEFAACLAKMKERGRKHLILDLRRNGGGYLNACISIASHLLRDADGGSAPVISCVERSGKTTLYGASSTDFGDYFAADSNVYIMADENTASASECLIGAMIDYKTLGFENIFIRSKDGVTCNTYGKGVAQNTYALGGGATVHLTFAWMNWPLSGKNIHDKGVTQQDGAVPVNAPFLRGERDTMLEEVLAEVKANNAE